MTVCATPRTSLGEARSQLRRLWGYSDFRAGQKAAVLAALRGRDVLAVLPTGGGKSICYQVPALLLPDLCLVISPLISLMQDQVAGLRRRGIPAAYLSSTQSGAERSSVIQGVRTGEIKVLYAAPERMAVLPAQLGTRRVSLLAVDEAHCISEWGHDFRPHYREIGKHRALLDNPQVVAVTATATPDTRDDIVRSMRLENPTAVVRSFDRHNLRFEVERFDSDIERLSRLRRLVRSAGGSKVVYVPTRDRTDGVAGVLRRLGVNAAPYHAALPGGIRDELQQRFIEGDLEVIVATNAFGMGIDKPDVRLVAHLGVPSRPEAYYQEAGRAGRDGGPARCSMLWTRQDLVLARLMAGVDTAATVRVRGIRQRALATMRRYAAGRRCRRRVLLEYLGERTRWRRCDNCDRC